MIKEEKLKEWEGIAHLQPREDGDDKIIALIAEIRSQRHRIKMLKSRNEALIAIKESETKKRKRIYEFKRRHCLRGA